MTAKYVNIDSTAIDIVVDDPTHGPIPITAGANDPETASLFERAVAGEFGPVEAFVAPSAIAPSSEQLLAYAAVKRERVEQAAPSGVIAFDIGPPGGPALTVDVTMSPSGQVKIAGAVQLAQIDPMRTFTWLNNDGPISLTAAQVTDLGVKVGAFVQDTFTTLAAVEAAIAAGDITTTAQIEEPLAPLPMWPAG